MAGTLSRAGWRVLVASVVAGAGGWWAPTTAGAGTATEISAQASATTTACGGWWRETRWSFMTVSVCGTEGLVTQDGQSSPAVGTTVVIDRYLCPKKKGDCSAEHDEGLVDRSGLTVDPLLRTAAIRTDIGGCVVDVRFWGVSGTTPDGGLWEHHGGGGALGLGANQTVTRQAEWTGRVCGQDLGGHPGEAWLSRSGSGNVGQFGRGPEGGE